MSDLEGSFQLAFGVQISSSKRSQLLTDTAAVILGLKPALLVDCGLTTAVKFRSLLVDILKSLGLHVREVLKGLCVVTIFSDVLLINVPAEDALWSVKCIPHYVNVDKGLLFPCVLTVDTLQHALIEGTISKVFDKLTTVAFETHCVQTEKHLNSEIPLVELDLLVGDFNLCTLFGRLLGYPIVYWFDTDNGYALDMVPLIRYSVKVKKNEQSTATDEAAQQCANLFLDERLVYSFTVPAVLKSEVEAIITNWTEKVNFISHKNALKLTISTDAVCLPYVAL